MCANIQGLQKNLDNMKLAICNDDLKIICLTETHVTSEIDDSELVISNYKLIRLDSSSKHTGGIVIYIRDGIYFEVMNCIALDLIMWYLSIKVKLNNIDFIVAAIYRSPSYSPKLFIDKIQEILETDFDFSSNIIFMGDFNINLFKDDTYSKLLISTFDSYLMKQIVDKPTRITEKTSSQIDLVFTNIAYLTCDVIDKISDHEVLIVKGNVFVQNEKKDKINKCVQLLDFVKMKTYLQDYVKPVNNDLMNMDNHIDVLYPSLLKLVNLGVKQCYYDKNIRLSNGKPNWFNHEIHLAIENKLEAYRKFNQRKCKENWLQYKIQRNRLVSAIRNAKKRYCENKLMSCESDPKKIWKVIKEITGSNCRNDFPTVIEVNGEKISSSDIQAKKLNIYYEKSIESIVESIVSTCTYNTIMGNVNNNNLGYASLNHFKLLKAEELEKIVSSQKYLSSFDNITCKLVKENYECFDNILLNIVNSSLMYGEICDELKIACIRPIPKKSNANEASQLRPINTLPFIEKILEYVVYKQLSEFVQKNNILKSNQSGFRNNHSCETAIQFVLNNWRLAQDNNEVTVAVFIDLMRAFETIDRSLLLDKLFNLGIRGNVLKWLKNYFQNRSHFVQIKADSLIINSENIESNYGVQQGSILGPLLFILFINDIDSTLEYCNIHLFADDMLIFLSLGNVVDLFSKVNKDVESLVKYLQNNKLKPNVNKTKYMILGKERDRNAIAELQLVIKMQDSKLEEVITFKYLGVIIDNELSFKMHYDYIHKKLNKKVGYFYRIGRNLNYKSRLLVYNAVILPHLQYCCSILALFNKTQINKLQILQNRCLRRILNAPFHTHINDMLIKLNFLNVKDIISYNVLIFIHRLTLGLLPSYLTNDLLANKEIHNYDTRTKNNYYIKSVKHKKSSNSLFYKGLSMYNKLPDSLKSIVRIKIYKKELKTYMMSHDISFI